MFYLVLPLAKIFSTTFLLPFTNTSMEAVHYPRAILEFRGLEYHTNTILESKKLKYESGCFYLFHPSTTLTLFMELRYHTNTILEFKKLEFFNAQMSAQPTPLWNAH